MSDTLTITRGHAIEEGFKSSSDFNKAFSDDMEVIELSPRDQTKVAEALLNPSPLNEAMKKALTERLIDVYGSKN